jgi:hypothetical protein
MVLQNVENRSFFMVYHKIGPLDFKNRSVFSKNLNYLRKMVFDRFYQFTFFTVLKTVQFSIL